MAEIQKNDVVQFNENHKWCGSLGIVTRVKDLGGTTKYMVAVPFPEKGFGFRKCCRVYWSCSSYR